MLIAQISDFHIVERGRKTCGVVAGSARLERLVRAINALRPRPDVVLVTGDLTHDGSAKQAEEARRLLDLLNIPYFVIPGNHDRRETLRRAFTNGACPSEDTGFLHYVVEGFGARLIGLDTSSPGKAGGAFCHMRAAWLKARLTEAAHKPTFLFLHHPPVKFGVLETDTDGFSGADLLGEIVQKFPAIERLFCGHIHLNAYTQWRGAIINTAPSATGMELMLDLTLTKSSAFYLVDPAFLLHYRTSDGGLVTHEVKVRDNMHPNMF